MVLMALVTGLFHLSGLWRLYTWTTIIAFTWTRQVFRHGVPWSINLTYIRNEDSGWSGVAFFLCVRF